MTDTKPPTTPAGDPKKPIRICLSKRDFESENLGKLLIGHFTIGAMEKISKLLEAEPSVSDDQIVRALFRAVAVVPDISHANGERLLTSEEFTAVTNDDIARFAMLFLEHQGWSTRAATDDPALPPVSILRRKLVDEINGFGKSVRDTFKFPKDLFSENTLKLISTSALAAEHLKELTGASKWAEKFARESSAFHQADELLKANSAFQIAKKYEEENKRLSASLGDLKSFEPLNPYSKPITRFDERQFDGTVQAIQNSEKNSPAARTAKTLVALDGKVDEVVDIARSVAELHGKTNEALFSGLSNLTTKWRADEHTAARNLKWAVVGIFVSAMLSFGAVVQDFFNNRDGDKQQQDVKTLIEDERNLMRQSIENEKTRNQELEKRVRELETSIAKKPQNAPAQSVK